MRTQGTAAELEVIRKRAVQAVAQGQSPSTVAKVLGVHRVTVHRWLRQARTPDGLDAIPIVRSPRLSDAQLRQLEVLLLQSATHHGWPNELWTAARVAALIQRHFGIDYHPEHVRKILKQRLGWTSQKPQRRPRQHNDQEVERWRTEEFPRIVTQAQARDAHLVFLDESCFSLVPTVRRTLAPRGRTPLALYWDKRDKISAISCITLSPRQQRPDLYFHLLPDKQNFHGEEVVAFLRALKEHLPRFTVVWDRHTIHSRSRVVKAFLAQNPSIVAEDFPGYAPELNPDELVWGWVKYGRLSNYAPADLATLRARVQQELAYLQCHPYALLDFVDHTDLPLTG